MPKVIEDGSYMKNEIKKLNKWLEIQAVKSENDPYWIENPQFSNYWPNYYRGLKNIDLLSEFSIIGHLDHNPLDEYLDKYKKCYNIYPSTGSCHYSKKSLDVT